MASSNFHHVVHKRGGPSSSSSSSSSSAIDDEVGGERKIIIVRFKECLKNHAASIGGNATDGCGEFMPCPQKEGTPQSFMCSACNCHRNFHRKEIQQYSSESDQYHLTPLLPNNSLSSPNKRGSNTSDQTSDHHHHHEDNKRNTVEGDHGFDLKEMGKACDEKVRMKMKKRFRTKFSVEQKEKMVRFAEKAGWRMQKVEECVVQQFCQEIGIKRRVLKVWMHNNKNTYAKTDLSSSTSFLAL